LYEHCAALIVPSICYETFGIILIEAFQNGAPVLARRLGPFPEIVEASGAGELFSTTDELRALLPKFIDAPQLRERLVAAGRSAFASRWSESAVLPRYCELVGRVARRRGRHEIAEVFSALVPEGTSPR
jgi:glycosyltransferase involved in cell wall biosynthesis